MEHMLTVGMVLLVVEKKLCRAENGLMLGDGRRKTLFFSLFFFLPSLNDSARKIPSSAQGTMYLNLKKQAQILTKIFGLPVKLAWNF